MRAGSSGASRARRATAPSSAASAAIGAVARAPQPPASEGAISGTRISGGPRASLFVVVLVVGAVLDREGRDDGDAELRGRAGRGGAGREGGRRAPMMMNAMRRRILQSFHQTLERRTLARVLNMPAWAWRSSACLSMCSRETQFWSAISMFSCMIIFTPSTFWSVLLS